MGLRIISYLILSSAFYVSNAQNSSLHRSDDEAPNYHRVKITSSSITIHGETNINQFKCRLNQPALNDSILVKNIWSNSKLDFEGLKLIYEVKSFKCGIPGMNSDFQELLKAEEQLYLLLQLNSITLLPDNDAFEELSVTAEVEINIAGVEKEVQIIESIVQNHSSAHMTLKGRERLLMSEFNIEPPTKFLGMVKVTDSIEVEFEISMEVSAFQ